MRAWADRLNALQVRRGRYFRRPELQQWLKRYVQVLLSGVDHKNGWQAPNTSWSKLVGLTTSTTLTCRMAMKRNFHFLTYTLRLPISRRTISVGRNSAQFDLSLGGAHHRTVPSVRKK